jgi:hypothetical protein
MFPQVVRIVIETDAGLGQILLDPHRTGAA